MHIPKVNRLWAAFAVAFGAALVIVTAASADTGLATASVIQVHPGAPTSILCPTPPGSPVPYVPGVQVTGEVFAGPFTEVSGRSREAKLLDKSDVTVDQSATLCFVQDLGGGNVIFVGGVNGNATISRQDSSGRNTLTAFYGSPITGTLNLGTYAINVQWLPGGAYTVTGVAGKFAKSFAVGESGAATATASSPGNGSPESGVLQISFNFESKK